MTWTAARTSDGTPMYETCHLGRVIVTVWTGSPAKDLDDGLEVCMAYVPIGDRAYPEGLDLVGRRRLDTRDREEAKRLALDLARKEIAYRGVPALAE